MFYRELYRGGAHVGIGLAVDPEICAEEPRLFSIIEREALEGGEDARGGGRVDEEEHVEDSIEERWSMRWSTGCGPKYRRERMQPPTLSLEDSDAAASAVHAPYTRLCTAEAAEA